MTRDEILNMPAGREMDALIEKFIVKRFYTFHNEYPDYSTNINNAWEVVEIILDLLSTPGQYGGERTGRCALYINRTRSLDFNTAWYQVYFARQGGKDKVAEFSMGESAPLAICRAALLAVMEVEP